ncbi:oxidoreductase [Sphingomonas sp. BK235]|uniref:oxidoreductase n=1 Tax=Sphingomonas sp. BK235 TaxID=2512131 RepID=UPI001043AA05|nr:oxidoreductase [Sphingomonas sp. BK235]TCP36066.1 NAD(P)-dependent dehydrogenase (short-subunit alcohol dehydrogenase family) [Sphingomonas sp. BK235]
MTTPQQPVGSPFGAASTAADVMRGIDLSGRTAIVTGGYSGLGLVTARALAEAGADVIVPARDVVKAREALSEVPAVQVWPMDLMDAASVAAFGSAFMDMRRPLSMLVNSAGMMASPLLRDPDGHESQFSVNHLGHFRLTCALWPALAREGGRVVAVSSRGHQIADIDFEDVDFKRRPYDKWIAYGQSKTANVLFARALDRRGSEHGVRSFSLHPGQILTGLARHLSEEEIAGFDVFDESGQPKVDPQNGLKTPEQGAATALWCATSALLQGLGGVYCEDCDVSVVNDGELGRQGVASWAIDDEHAERLWRLSVDWTGQQLKI